jgi:hypothetical protein
MNLLSSEEGLRDPGRRRKSKGDRHSIGNLRPFLVSYIRILKLRDAHHASRMDTHGHPIFFIEKKLKNGIKYSISEKRPEGHEDLRKR